MTPRSRLAPRILVWLRSGFSASREQKSGDWCPFESSLFHLCEDTMVHFPAHPGRAEMKKEVATYQNLHPEHFKQYLGRYVVIFQGKLVDHDDDLVALH